MERIEEIAETQRTTGVSDIAGRCLSCGRPVKGRIDKKFCDAGCKNVYHNRRQRAERKEISVVDLVLKHNRRILKACLGREKTRRVSREELLAEGYRFEFFTHYFTNHRGKRYCFCYDHGWLDLHGDEVLVVRQPDV